MALVRKKPPASAGDIRDASSIPVWEDPLEEGMATHCSVLAWRIPWTEEPGELQSMGSERDTREVTEHRHMCICISIALLYTRNSYNTVNKLYFN